MKNISYELIEKLREAGSGSEAEKQILSTSEDPAWLYALSPSRGNLVEWYPWTKEMSVLVIGGDYGSICGVISEKAGSVDVKDSRAEDLEVIRFRYPERLREQGGNIGLIKNVVSRKYDVVVIPELTKEVLLDNVPALAAKKTRTVGGEELPEISGEDLYAFLQEAASRLKAGGALLLAADNLSALKYMTGADPEKDRVYAEYEELSEITGHLGFADRKWYYPLPDNRLTKDIFSDAYLPGEGDFRGISEAYDAPRYLLCDEEAMYGKLCRNHAFPDFAPGYLLVLCGYDPGEARGETGEAAPEEGTEGSRAAKGTDRLPEQIYIRYNRTRIPEYQTKTEIFERKGVRRVVKTALSKAANDHILSLEWKYKLLNNDRTSELLVQAPEFRKEGALCSAAFDYLDGMTLSRLLAEEISGGKAPVARIKEALELVLGIGAHECHNMDCLFENVMKCGSEYYYVDYEWVFEHVLDRDYLRYRILRYWYEAYRESLYAYPQLSDFLGLFGIREEELPEFEHMEESFQEFVHGQGQQAFLKNYRQPAKGLTEIRRMEQKLEEYTEWNLRLQDEVQEHKETISKNLEIQRLSQNHIVNIEAINRIHEADIAAMQKELAYLRKHEGLLSRMGRGINGAFTKMFPIGSRKRKVLHYCKETLRHPVNTCRLYLTEEGRNRIRGDFRIGEIYFTGGRLTLPDCLHQADLMTGENAGATGGTSAAAAATEAAAAKVRPRVSIVLPVYDQVAYTYACIQSILEHTDFNETPYEVILADDVSKDSTASIGDYIRGLVVSRNTENQGFLKNCNQAAKKAVGDYIFFLNNDTKVTDGWLSSLLSLMDGDESIGMAGSKLIYPDGRLQEAGGIIWSDGSGWNYGRLDDPEKPQYNYLKEVDYISGAAIMIRRSLWEEIGGFDERFAPAYCEDSDLAFEVRKHGKRVVYQPKSVVVHFEGISNGTDVNGEGLKKYQVVNQEKFREKWKEELKEQSRNTGNPNPFTARDRSQKKPCVLVIDHYVPTWDKDAGSKTTYQYIRMFLKKGYNVKLLGDNFLHEEPYSTELMQMGVEILYGEDMQSGIWDWIRENQLFIDIAYLNRPHIAIKYIDFLRENTGIRCIYYGHDLHFLRLLREYELNGDIRTKRESDYWKSIEFTVMQKADMSYYPSEAEVEAIHALDPKIRVKAITAYLWEDFLPCGKSGALLSETGEETDYAKREGLLFVGGFAHPPNEDGVLWFVKDVFPKIREKVPDMNFYIVGSKAPEEITALGAEPEKTGIHVLGYVSDEELAALYQKTKITVVPLRYGAGVKGKVVEAIYNGAVVVTTSVGAEGIPDPERVLATVNETETELREHPEAVAESFAEAVLKLYRNDGMLAAISSETQRYIKRHYSMDAAWRIIAPDFAMVKRSELQEKLRTEEKDAGEKQDEGR